MTNEVTTALPVAAVPARVTITDPMALAVEDAACEWVDARELGAHPLASVSLPERAKVAERAFRTALALLSDDRARLLAQCAALRAELAAVQALALECATELEAEVRENYGWPDVHPANVRRIERDCVTVREIRALVGAATPALPGGPASGAAHG